MENAIDVFHHIAVLNGDVVHDLDLWALANPMYGVDMDPDSYATQVIGALYESLQIEWMELLWTVC